MTAERPLLPRRGLLLAAAALFALPARAATPAPPLVDIWKSPTCGCCGDWVKHLEASGFATRVHLVADTGPVRQRLGFDERLGSCHTATVEGYALEGHVPAREIRRLLQDKPAGVVGLAVPGMPLGTPGMDQPAYGGRKTPHDVLLVRRDGGTSVYQSYR